MSGQRLSDGATRQSR